MLSQPSFPFHFGYSSAKKTKNLALLVTRGRPTRLVCLQGMRLGGCANGAVVWIWMDHIRICGPETYGYRACGVVVFWWLGTLQWVSVLTSYSFRHMIFIYSFIDAPCLRIWDIVKTRAEEKCARTLELPLLVRRLIYSFSFVLAGGWVCGVFPLHTSEGKFQRPSTFSSIRVFTVSGIWFHCFFNTQWHQAYGSWHIHKAWV